MALFGSDKSKKPKDAKKAEEQKPKRLIPEDNLAELTKFFEPMQEPVELVVFTDPKRNAPYNTFMESLCRELAELTPKITVRSEPLDGDAAKLKSIKAEMHPLHAAEIMMEANETCLPVVENQAVIGVVRLIDIFRTLAGSCSL